MPMMHKYCTLYMYKFVVEKIIYVLTV